MNILFADLYIIACPSLIAVLLYAIIDAAHIVCGPGYRICNGHASTPSVRCLSHRSMAATTAIGFATECLVGRRYRSVAAGTVLFACWCSAANAGSIT